MHDEAGDWPKRRLFRVNTQEPLTSVHGQLQTDGSNKVWSIQWCLGATTAGGVCWEGLRGEAALSLVRDISALRYSYVVFRSVTTDHLCGAQSW